MNFNKTVLPNGLRIITVPMADNPSVTVLIMVEAGSKYETKEVSGLSHFLEHMVFKGTPRRPKATDISRELDALGAQSNAFTSHEYTGFYAKAASKHLDAVIDLLSDLYVNPLLDANEVQREKGVIIEEIRMYNDLPQVQVQSVLSNVLYGDQPAGWDVIGTEETVGAFTREQLVSYRNDNYVSSATTVIVAGSFDEEDCKTKIANAFGGVSTSSKKAKLAVKESQSRPEIKLAFKETDQTHLVIGLRSFPITDPRLPIMHVLSTVLGKGMSSRLFAKMRDQLGICYYVRAEQDSYTDHGVLTISAGVDNSRLEQGIRGILGECERLKTEVVSEAELKKAKDYLSGTTLLELETSDARAEFCAYQEVLKGRVELPDEIIRKINAVTSAEVQKLAREIFVNDKLNMAIIGKSKDVSAFEPYFKFA